MMFPIKSAADLKKISSSVKWQYFEKLVAFIFEENGYDAKQNIIIKGEGTKRQFDVIARSSSITFLVECKKWKSGNEKSSALKSAVRKHLERCLLYASIHEKEVTPLMVTLLDDHIILHKGVPVVPIMKLNGFLQDFSSF